MARRASAYGAARSRPLPDVPACKIAGPFCGERTTLSGPRDLKKRPTCSMRCTLLASANIGRSRSMTRASASQLDHSLRQTSMYSRAVVASIGVRTIGTEIGIEVAVDGGDHVPARAAAGQGIDGG